MSLFGNKILQMLRGNTTLPKAYEGNPFQDSDETNSEIITER